jgi:hypothetical protein
VLAKFKRVSTPAPYTVRKKIRRGPRPKTKPLPQSFGGIHLIRPPGLQRPALSSKFANNNAYLLQTSPGVGGDNKGFVPRPEFVPSDDRPEPFDYYQLLLQAHAATTPVPLPPTTTTKKPTIKTTSTPKPDEEESEENDEEENSGSEEEDEEEADEEQLLSDVQDNYLHHQSGSTNGTKEEELSGSFLRKVVTRVKTMSIVGALPKLPFMSNKDKKTNNETTSGGVEEEERRKNKAPPTPKPTAAGPKKGLRLPKRPPRTTTTTTTPKSSWLFFG